MWVAIVPLYSIANYYYLQVKGDIHTQVAMLNVNMTLESETPTPFFNIKCGN